MDKKTYLKIWRANNKERFKKCVEEWRKKNENKLHNYYLQRRGLYNAWSGMKARCNRPTYKQYKDYGGRGITYSYDWETFIGFKKDMQAGFRKGLTLERINVNGNYYKENCRWATRQEQSENKRCNIKIEYKGKLETIISLARELGISYELMRCRYYRNWPSERIIIKERL